MTRGRSRRMATGLGLLCLGLLPWVASTYVVTFLYLALVSVALAQSYDWVGGHLGYMNLGQAAFFGVGAYAGGVLLTKALPPAVAFAAAALVPAAFAAAIAVPFFRLRGAYFALATFGLVALMELLAHNLETVTGGALGLSLPPGNRLHAPEADRAGQHAIRVNDQYRIVFRFEGQDAHDVCCTDYH